MTYRLVKISSNWCFFVEFRINPIFISVNCGKSAMTNSLLPAAGYPDARSVLSMPAAQLLVIVA